MSNLPKTHKCLYQMSHNCFFIRKTRRSRLRIKKYNANIIFQSPRNRNVKTSLSLNTSVYLSTYIHFWKQHKILNFFFFFKSSPKGHSQILCLKNRFSQNADQNLPQHNDPKLHDSTKKFVHITFSSVEYLESCQKPKKRYRLLKHE